MNDGGRHLLRVRQILGRSPPAAGSSDRLRMLGGGLPGVRNLSFPAQSGCMADPRVLLATSIDDSAEALYRIVADIPDPVARARPR